MCHDVDVFAIRLDTYYAICYLCIVSKWYVVYYNNNIVFVIAIRLFLNKTMCKLNFMSIHYIIHFNRPVSTV